MEQIRGNSLVTLKFYELSHEFIWLWTSCIFDFFEQEYNILIATMKKDLYEQL